MAAKMKNKMTEIYKNRWIYAFLAPGIIFLLVFSYGPMYGLVLAFKDFKMNKGIMGSPWADPIYKNFLLLTKNDDFFYAFFNTFRMSFMGLLINFPAPIILAILLNELRGTKYKKMLQTVYTFPHFLSWVVVGGLLTSFLSSDGFINVIITKFGGEKVQFMTSEPLVRPLLYLSSVWKGVGWSSIVYLAAIAGINPELYEAAEIDGANRFQKMRHITWPGIKPTVVILLILALGGLAGGNFDQVMNLTNPVVRDAAENLSTYIYRITFESVPNYGLSTAMGMGSSIINFALLMFFNKMAKLLGEGGIM